MGRGEIFVQMAVDFADDAKLRALDRFGRHARPARDLYVQMVCYCKRTLSDGFVPDAQLAAMVYPDPAVDGRKDAQRLADVGAIERREGGWYLPGFLKRNPSRAAVRAAGDVKAGAAIRGNHERWHVRGGVVNPTCPLCIADGSQNGSHTDRTPIADTIAYANRVLSPETETETEKFKDSSPPAAPARDSDPLPDDPALPGLGRTPRAKLGTDDDPDFTRFWAAYPKRTDKGHARTAWAKAVKAGADPETIIAAATRYATTRDGQDRAYTAYPATWLHGERWDDTPHAANRTATGEQSPWWDN